jgi:hypothetical protein
MFPELLIPFQAAETSVEAWLAALPEGERAKEEEWRRKLPGNDLKFRVLRMKATRGGAHHIAILNIK